MTAAPSGSVPSWRSNLYTSSVPSSLSALVASSKKRTSGRCSTACAIANFCCSPPESANSQFASSERSRSFRASNFTTSNAFLTSSSLYLSAFSGYATACFSVP
mmetsp:Transcript_21638/g.37974  ORF Transcript_21638/g.37974 Transcript_21638/m.37974 type:complete len:104 (-) Transcript_21638:2080-2391(-)